MNNCPYRVTICSPIYGVEKYIERCAVSLFEQTYSDIDYIFVNDDTKDQSIDILKSIIARYPQREKYVRIINHEYNRGLSAARNTGVENVQTEFLVWVDSDDYVDTTMVERLVLRQMKTNADIVCGGVISLFPQRSIIEKRNNNMPKEVYLHKLLSKKTEHWIWGKLIKTSLYKENGIKNIEGINMAEDYQTLPFLVYHSNKVVFEESPIYYYNRFNETSLTNVYSEKKQQESFKSLLYVRERFAGTNYENDVQKYLLIMFFEHMKPFIKGEKISESHKIFFASSLKGIPLNVYIYMSPKVLLSVIYSRLFII